MTAPKTLMWSLLSIGLLTLGGAHATSGPVEEAPCSSVALKDMAMQRHASGDTAPARDGNIAIREEYEAAVALNTVSAYDLFIARHPTHNLAVKAQQRRDVLLGNDNRDGAPDGEER